MDDASSVIDQADAGRAALREWLRGEAAACPACGHGLRGLDVQVCPECGNALAVVVKAGPGPLAFPARVILWWWIVTYGIGMARWFPFRNSLKAGFESIISLVKSYPWYLLSFGWSILSLMLASGWLIVLRLRRSDLAWDRERSTRRVCTVLLVGSAVLTAVSYVFETFR